MDKPEPDIKGTEVELERFLRSLVHEEAAAGVAPMTASPGNLSAPLVQHYLCKDCGKPCEFPCVGLAIPHPDLKLLMVAHKYCLPCWSKKPAELSRRQLHVTHAEDPWQVWCPHDKE